MFKNLLEKKCKHLRDAAKTRKTARKMLVIFMFVRFMSATNNNAYRNL